MCHYSHLTLEEREKLLYFSAKGYSVTKLAEELKRNKSAISRELRRNRDGKLYLPAKAQQMYSERRKACRPRKRLDDPALFQTVKEKFLEHQWSPEQIAGRLAIKRKGMNRCVPLRLTVARNLRNMRRSRLHWIR